jgi:hypothetical protein
MHIFGINIILYAKLNNKTYIATEVIRHMFVSVKESVEILDYIPEYISYFIVPNYAYIKEKIYCPTVFVRIPYEIMYTKYTRVLLNDLFMYQYEPLPFEETYVDSEFYRDLYILGRPYKNLENINAKAIFQSSEKLIAEV